MERDIEKVLISEQEISSKIAEIGEQISKDYKDKNLLVVSVLKGSVVFMADLMRAIKIPCEIDFLSISSYGNGAKSSGKVNIIKDISSDLSGYDVIIVEDILDSGLTLTYLMDMMKGRNAKSIKICTFLDKPEGRKVEITPDYSLFTVPDCFIVGYGLDYAQKYRNLPYVAELKQEVYSK